MEVKDFLRLYSLWQRRRIAYRIGLLAIAERVAKERALISSN